MRQILAYFFDTVAKLQSFFGMMEVLHKVLVSSHLIISVEMHEVSK